jgi:hypothetical protein
MSARITVDVGKQVALDEFIFTPVHIAAFFSFLTAAEGGNWEVCAHCCSV